MAGEPVPRLPVHLRGRRGGAGGRGAPRGGRGRHGAARVAPSAAPRLARASTVTTGRAAAHGALRGRADTHRQSLSYLHSLTFTQYISTNIHFIETLVLRLTFHYQH